jgi:hypothetical protein
MAACLEDDLRRLRLDQSFYKGLTNVSSTKQSITLAVPILAVQRYRGNKSMSFAFGKTSSRLNSGLHLIRESTISAETKPQVPTSSRPGITPAKACHLHLHLLCLHCHRPHDSAYIGAVTAAAVRRALKQRWCCSTAIRGSSAMNTADEHMRLLEGVRMKERLQ